MKDPQERENRQMALNHALTTRQDQGHIDPDEVVRIAEKYYAFLKGADE